MKKLLAILITFTLSFASCGVTEFLGRPLPNAYDNPPATTHDIYRLSVIGCGGEVFTIVAIEVPFSTHGDGGLWYVIPVYVDLRWFCQ